MQHRVTDLSSLVVTTVQDSHLTLNSSLYSSVSLVPFSGHLIRIDDWTWFLWFWFSVLSKGLGLHRPSGSSYAWTCQENTAKSSASGPWDPRLNTCSFAGTLKRDTTTLQAVFQLLIWDSTIIVSCYLNILSFNFLYIVWIHNPQNP